MTDVTKPTSGENLIYRKIQQAKTRGIAFVRVASIFKSAPEDRNISDHFLDAKEVSFIDYNPNIAFDQLGEAILLTIPLQTGQLDLEIQQVASSFYNYTVSTSDGQQMPANKETKHYRGIIKDDPNSLVAISFWENEVMGLITNDLGNFNLSFDKKRSVHIFFNDKNLKQKMDFRCGTQAKEFTHYNPDVLFRSSKSSVSLGGTCVRLYLESDHEIYQTRGSLTSVQSFITGLFNQVATLYENENIQVRLSDLYVWTVPDPYTASGAAALLAEFQLYRTSFNGDLGQLLTFRFLEGWAAGFDGLCNPAVSKRLSVAGIYNEFELFPLFSWSIFIVTHEFGHLFGSRHTHACVWNGNNTAIDGCGSCMENPNPSIHTCNNCSRPPLPTGGGTIMSYCYDTSVGVNFTLGFGLQPGNVIRNSVANADCLCECIDSVITGPDYICISGVYSIADLPSGATVTGWSADPSSLVSFSGSGTSVTVSKVGPYTPDPRPVTLYATLSTDCGTMTVQRQVSIGTINPNITDINISGGPGHEGYLCEHAIGFNTYELVLNPSGPVDGPFVLELLSYPGGAVLHSQQVNLATGILPFTWF